MSEKEIFAAIQANAEQATESARIEHEARQAERKRINEQKRKNATKALFIRVVVAIALCGAMWLAEILGLMATGLVVGLVFATFVYLAFYAGAWAQFMWCRGELLK
jgi:cation transport ATPase